MAAVLAFLPTWRGDETLYSWAAGFHAICGNGSARDTGAVLFGVEHACREYEAPTNLHHFADATGGYLGCVEALLLTRSAIGLFAPFLSPARRSVLTSRMAAKDGPGWRALFGMPASGLDDTKSLRFCATCIHDDMIAWGLPRWRLPHQLSGAWVCLDHGLVLQSMKSGSSIWQLPPQTIKQPASCDLDSGQKERLIGLATLAWRIVGVEQLDVEAIRQSVLTALREQAVTGWAHPLDSKRLSSWFADSPLSAWLRTVDLQMHSLASGLWIHDLLRDRRGDHPLKWMLLWCTLFAVDAANQSRFLDPASAPHWDSYGQGQIWGVSGDSVPADIQRIVAEAPTLEEAAHSLGMSRIALRRRLAELGTNPRAFRLSLSEGKRRLHAVDEIGAYIARNPDCSKSDIHRDCKAAVSWLRAHDSATLVTVLNNVEGRRPQQLRLHVDAGEKAAEYARHGTKQ